MPDPDDNHRQAVALFRYGVIADLVHLPPGSAGITERLRAKASKDYVIPASPRTRVAVETIRDWLKRYRRGGFDALLPKPRADRGQPRRLPDTVAEALIAIKEQHPKLSVRRVIERARASGQIPADLTPPSSTVHRLLTREGLMVKKTDTPTGADRRRFVFQHAGELWMSDVMHGVTVGNAQGRRKKTYLIAFIDDATRVIPYAAFAFAENTVAFLPVFKQALIRRGIPERLYVDNGANYRSRQLALVCAKLGTALIHARPHQPQGKGKIERFFRTLRAALLTQLTGADTVSLDALNRRLWGFIEGEYHHTPHRGLDGKTPLEQWALVGDPVRFPDASLDALFLFEAKRRVMNDRTVSLNGRLYEVDAVLVGATVTLRYDPAVPPTRPLAVVHQGQPAGQATPLDAYANTTVRRDRPSWRLETDTPAPEPPPSRLTLGAFANHHNEEDE
ncbi:MAG: DDE-type integrase/transposase/recombinase [Gammaproteobacteria bacterium]|jgi:transposase InsO family protein